GMSASLPINKPPRDWSKWGLGIASLLIYGFLYLPIFVVILYSFSATKVNAWPIQGYTLDWYRELRADTEIRNAIGLSVRLGLVAALSSLVLGTLGALALDRYRFPGKP